MYSTEQSGRVGTHRLPAMNRSGAAASHASITGLRSYPIPPRTPKTFKRSMTAIVPFISASSVIGDQTGLSQGGDLNIDAQTSANGRR